MDVNALTAEYSKLPPEELKMHYIASKAALMQTMQAAQGAGAGGPPPDASAPPSPAGSPAPDAPPAAPPAPEGPPMALKNEMKPAPVPMAKSEGLSKAEADDLRAQIEGLTKAVTIVLGAPQRKAVTSLAFLAKSEEPAKTLSKAEVDAKLKDKIRTNLSKSDRALINQFTLNQIDVSKIEHLLK